MKKRLLILLFTLVCLDAKPLNIIFMIGDGMGPSVTTAYRYYKDDLTTKKVEKTVLDELFVGTVSTYALESPPVLTDSAAAATALATGVKTKSAYIAMDKDKHEVQTVLEKAKLMGYQTAMVVTSTLTHATPASFLAHHDNRREEVEIAKDYLKRDAKGELKFDLLMGGGLDYFNEAFNDFSQKLIKEEIALYTPSKSLEDVKKLPAMVFIAKDKPKFALDEDEHGLGKLRTAKMTQKALSLMDVNRPFFMMIEGSQIDWCGHENDMACVMSEMNDFTAAVKVAKAYVDRHENTLLIITADHSTGGLAIGEKISKASTFSKKERKRKAYEWRPELLKAVKVSATAMTAMLYGVGDLNKIQTLFKKYMGLTLTQKELKKLRKQSLKPCKKFNKCKLHDKINALMNKKSRTAWTTHGHTGVDVPLYAYGQHAELFRGFMDNTEIALKIFSLLK